MVTISKNITRFPADKYQKSMANGTVRVRNSIIEVHCFF
jgi:hypothetical protein